ncbi:Uncharacterized protein RNJ44_04349 [Nakaseomyces bracarensis]|uniref:Uncharacterized protein n=1 Tax=Nakaseomyces bracarensis TaxID=273131 RepID=A0ABR4NUS5_9SACH
MDRVRALLGNSRRNTEREVRNEGRNEERNEESNEENIDNEPIPLLPPTFTEEPRHHLEDDQTTMFESDDMRTLDTLPSESSTIGDFQRLGFVNRCPRFDEERVVPFVSILLGRGFYSFNSEESYKAYLRNKRNLERVDIASGLGIPMFHAVPSSVVKSMFGSKSVPVMRVYKYIVVRTEASDSTAASETTTLPGAILDFAPSEAILEATIPNSEFSIYKYEFCTIYKDVISKTGRVEHMFTFNRLTGDPKAPLSMEQIPMVNYVQMRNTDTNYKGLNLRWYGSTGLASPFGSNNIKLLVLDDSMPSYMENKSISEFEQASRGQRLRPLGYLPIWARYSDDKVTVLPKKRAIRVATLDIREEINEIDPNDPNTLYKVPWDTQVLTTMAMLLHEYESRKDKRHNAVLGAQLGTPGMLI